MVSIGVRDALIGSLIVCRLASDRPIERCGAAGVARQSVDAAVVSHPGFGASALLNRLGVGKSQRWIQDPTSPRRGGTVKVPAVPGSHSPSCSRGTSMHTIHCDPLLLRAPTCVGKCRAFA